MSAEALLPAAALLSSWGSQAVADIQGVLWDALLEVDDLSPSTGAALPLRLERLLLDPP